jgi:outer membrane protein
MSESEARRLERDILSRQRKLGSEKKDHEAEMSLRLNEEREKLYKHISEVVRKIGKDEGFDLILTPQSVAYFNPKIDISDQVLSRLKRSR